MTSSTRTLPGFLLLVLLIPACRSLPATVTSSTHPPGTTTASRPILVGAGDVADCDSQGDEATAALLDVALSQAEEGVVFVAGDAAYPDGTEQQFADCYHPSWGRHKERTRPAVGNHEYHTPDAKGYFGYFGDAAGPAGAGYYSYDLGAWHVVVLNSNCEAIGGCQAGSDQESWLRADLAAHPAACTVAYWHHPLFTSGTTHGGTSDVQPFWQALYEHGAEVVINGHEHNYERFAPQDPMGNADPEGIRQFVAGTGGGSLYHLGPPAPHSEMGWTDGVGVLKLTLHPRSYTWEFISYEREFSGEGSLHDSGTEQCH